MDTAGRTVFPSPRGDKENRAINGNDLTDTSFRPLAGIKKIGKSTPIAFHLPMQYNIPILFCIGQYMHFMGFVAFVRLKTDSNMVRIRFFEPVLSCIFLSFAHYSRRMI